MNERRRLAQRGIIAVTVALDGEGKLVGAPSFSMAGIPIDDERDAFVDEAVESAAGAARKGAKDPEKLREAIRLAVRRTATHWTGKKPVVNVSLMEV
jgi:ribonuclease J